MTVPVASVVVCAFNEERNIRECLLGLLNQQYETARLEILVIENESTDSTFKVACAVAKEVGEAGPYLRVVKKVHGGLSESRNVGIAMSLAPYVLYVDADAVPDTHWVAEMVAALERGADYVGGRIELLNEGSRIARLLQRTRHRQFFGPRLFNDQFVGCNMGFRRSALEAVGGFNVAFVSRGDDSTIQERLARQFRYGAAVNAVVWHQRPETMRGYLRAEWKAATLGAVARRALGQGLSLRVVVLRCEQLGMTVAPLLWCLFPLGNWVVEAFAVASTFLVLRRLAFRPLGRGLWKGLVQDYGISGGTLVHLSFGMLHAAVEVAGTAVGEFQALTRDAPARRVGQLCVLEECSSRSKAP